jgi:LCP family protein required for cell wall assembly
MDKYISTLRQHRGATVAVIVIGVVAVAVFALLLFQNVVEPSREAAQRQTVAELQRQFQVVITPEMTATPDATITPFVIATKTPAPATPSPTPSWPVTPAMDLNAMPVRACAECMNILLMGLDQRPDEDAVHNRSDTMIILSLNTATHQAGMLSIPRDLYVPMPNSTRLDRINTAVAIGGPEYAMRTVEYNTGIAIQHYARINFGVVIDLVDLVGGIDVYVDQDINDPTYPDMNYGYEPFVISAGWNHMDGVTALKYARTRHQTSDFYRMRRQQQIIMALRDRALSTDAFSTLLPNAPQILSKLSNSVTTDLNPGDMIQLILAAKDIPIDNIARLAMDESAAQPWVAPSGAQLLIPNREQIAQLAARLYNQPAPVRQIAIENGTLTKTLVLSAQTVLEKYGFSVVQSEDAQTPVRAQKSVVIDYSGSNQLTSQVAIALGLPVTSISTTTNVNRKVDVLVILGDDFHPIQTTQ